MMAGKMMTPNVYDYPTLHLSPPFLSSLLSLQNAISLRAFREFTSAHVHFRVHVCTLPNALLLVNSSGGNHRSIL